MIADYAGRVYDVLPSRTRTDDGRFAGLLRITVVAYDPAQDRLTVHADGHRHHVPGALFLDAVRTGRLREAAVSPVLSEVY